MKNDALDHYDLDSNRLLIRDVDILQLAQNRHYLQNVWFTLSGEDLPLDATDKRVAAASQMLRREERIQRIYAIWRALQNVPQLDVMQRFMALLMQIEPTVACSRNNYADRYQQDFSTILLLPWLTELARCPQSARPLPELTGCASFSRWFMSTLREGETAETNINFMMSLLLGGFGIVTPTSATVRFIASTKNSLSYALIGALCAAGPAHLGACQRVTELLNSVSDALNQSSLKIATDAYCSTRPWPGFGHPVMPRDTRVDAFFNYYAQEFSSYKALADSITLRSGINPNVDYLIGSAFSCWQVMPQIAILLFFICRAPVLLGHYRLRYEAHSFGMPSSELRDKYKELPKHWL